jgi:hypothetical protein
MACDMLLLNRGGKNKKEELIECLLDFLSQPEEEDISPSAAGGKKGGKKKTAAKKKKSASKSGTTAKPKAASKPKKASVSKSTSGGGDPFSLLKDIEKGEQPSKDTLRQWVKAYVCCFDMETVNIKDALATAEAKFGVELQERKTELRGMLGEEMI